MYLILMKVLSLHVQTLIRYVYDTRLDFRTGKAYLFSERQGWTHRSSGYQYIGFLQTSRLYELVLAIVVENDTSYAAVAEAKINEILARYQFVRLKFELSPADSEVFRTR